mmetsp:Transcript_24872/g.78687  ORF Transcript_24872/g.78687 Transcript_24872/m.78687 type:complete len:318 (-) Transcript_24872:1372-2325(-)
MATLPPTPPTPPRGGCWGSPPAAAPRSSSARIRSSRGRCSAGSFWTPRGAPCRWRCRHPSPSRAPRAWSPRSSRPRRRSTGAPRTSPSGLPRASSARSPHPRGRSLFSSSRRALPRGSSGRRTRWRAPRLWGGCRARGRRVTALAGGRPSAGSCTAWRRCRSHRWSPASRPPATAERMSGSACRGRTWTRTSRSRPSAPSSTAMTSPCQEAPTSKCPRRPPWTLRPLGAMPRLRAAARAAGCSKARRRVRPQQRARPGRGTPTPPPVPSGNLIPLRPATPRTSPFHQNPPQIPRARATLAPAGSPGTARAMRAPSAR